MGSPGSGWGDERHFSCDLRCSSDQHPFTPSLNELVHQHAQVRENKPADVEAKKFGSVPRAKLKTHLCFVCMSQSGILDLSSYLICGSSLAQGHAWQRAATLQ